MALTKTAIEWHDIRVDPDDIPSPEDPVMITVEHLDGSRAVWLDAYISETDDGYQFVTQQFDSYSGVFGQCVVWYPVIAWAYPPDPYYI